MELAVNGRRFSGCMVSGIRIAVQTVTASEIAAMKTKIMCHSENSMTNWPMPGATTGITMNTMKISDITSAMRRPPNTSRTKETAMTRVAAAPMPWIRRSASRIVKVGANEEAKAAAT